MMKKKFLLNIKELENVFEKYIRKGPAIHIRRNVTPVKILIVSPFYNKPFYRTYYVASQKKLQKYKEIVGLQRRGFTGNIKKWLNDIGVTSLYFSLGKIYHDGKEYKLDSYLFYETQSPTRYNPKIPFFKRFDDFHTMFGFKDFYNRKYLGRNLVFLERYSPDKLYQQIDYITKKYYKNNFRIKRKDKNTISVNIFNQTFGRDNKLSSKSNFELEYKRKENNKVDVNVRLRKNNKYTQFPKLFSYLLNRHLNVDEIDTIKINIDELKKAKNNLLSHLLFMGFQFEGVSTKQLMDEFSRIKNKYKKLFKSLETLIQRENILNQTENELLKSNYFYGYLTALAKSKSFEYERLNRIFYEMVKNLGVKTLTFKNSRDKRNLSKIMLHRYTLLNNTFNDYHIQYFFRNP